MEPTEKRKKPYLSPTVQVVEFAVEIGSATSGQVEVGALGGLWFGLEPSGSNDVYAGRRMTQDRSGSGSYFGNVFTDDESHF